MLPFMRHRCSAFRTWTKGNDCNCQPTEFRMNFAFFSIRIEVKGKQMDIVSMTNGRGGGGCRGPRGMSFNGTYHNRTQNRQPLVHYLNT